MRVLRGKISDNWLEHWDFLLLDVVFLQIAYIAAYIFRNGFHNLYANTVYLNIGIIICLAGICAAFFLEGYQDILKRGYFQEFKAVVKHVFTVCVFAVSYLFLTKSSEEFSRISFVVFACGGVLILYLERLLWKTYLLRNKKGYYRQKALIILTVSSIGEQVVRNVRKNSRHERKIIGVVFTDRSDLVGSAVEGEKVVCSKENFCNYIQRKWVDEVLINTGDTAAVPKQLVDSCIKMGITVHFTIPEIGEEVRNQKIETVAGYVVISAGISAASPGELFLKRLMDIAGAAVGLVITGIVYIFIAPAIYFSSPGPVLFSQIRVGKNGRKFKIYKFRSMYPDAEEKKKDLLEKNQMKGQIFKMEDDPRIIGSGPAGKRHGLGWFLRKTSIDELPQFWNILKGDMSLVGTRPPTVDEWERYERHHRGRLAIKPGLTGLWQVSGRSDIQDFEEIVKMDIQYIQNWNLGLDIKILLKTIWVVLKGEGSR